MTQLRLQIIFLTLLLAGTHAHAQSGTADAHVLSLLTAKTRIAAQALPKAFVMDGAIAEWID